MKGNGIGFGTILFIVFLVLKLTGHITWSWWWIFAPFWIPLSVVGVLLIIAWILAGISFGGKKCIKN